MADQLSQDLVAAFDALFGDHPETRAVHAKGTCCAATFVATPNAAAITRAPHMQGSSIRTTVRFSNGSGDPSAHDGGIEPRGMAVKFHLDERRATDIVSINHSAFIVRTPEEVLEFLRLRRPDPQTGQVDLAALGAFVGARPESRRAAQMLLATPPLASFLQTRYFAIHAFRFVASDGSEQYGRYRWDPDAGLASLTPEEAAGKDSDYLRAELLESLARHPATFTLHIQFAGDGDDPNDPTTEWADDGESIVAGRLAITGPVTNPEDECERLVFDPTRLCDGIEASDDKILNARPAAYAVSSRRRNTSR